MRILQRHVAAGLAAAALTALCALVALFSFFSLIDQLADTGRGNYTVIEALRYVSLTTPKLAYELFPIAAVIGGMAALGMLAKYSELVVIYTSGVSKVSLAVMLGKASLILVVLAVLVGEFIAPISEEAAQQRRSLAMTDQITLKTKYGYWARDGNSFINIRRILPGNRVEEVFIYEFDQDDRLRTSISARAAMYENQRWRLLDVEQTRIEEGEVTVELFPQAEWPSLLDPELISFVMVQPQYLNFLGLFRYIDYLRQNAQESAPYEQALWKKIIKPFSICAMVLLAVLLVRCESRFTQVGQRIFLGSLIGIVFHICDQISGHLGLVYQIPAIISVTAPTALLWVIILWLLRT
jgi:lipopolysaccharide export system permease protein